MNISKLIKPFINVKYYNLIDKLDNKTIGLFINSVFDLLNNKGIEIFDFINIENNNFIENKNNNFIENKNNNFIENKNNNFIENKNNILKIIENKNNENKNKSSYDIGFCGENYVRNLLLKTNCWILNNKKTKNKSGDILGYSVKRKINNIDNFMVEIKKYNNIVPYSEVEKFYRDLQYSSNINLAIFISIGQNISRIREDCLIENKNIDGIIRHIVYLKLNMDEDMDLKLMKLVSDILIMCETVYLDNNENDIIIFNNILEKLYDFNKLKNDIRDFRNSSDKFYNDLINSLSQMELNIKNNIEKIINKYQQNIVYFKEYTFDIKNDNYKLINFYEEYKLQQNYMNKILELFNLVNNNNKLFNIKVINENKFIIYEIENKYLTIEFEILKTKIKLKMIFNINKEQILDLLILLKNKNMFNIKEINIDNKFIIIELNL